MNMGSIIRSLMGPCTLFSRGTESSKKPQSTKKTKVVKKETEHPTIYLNKEQKGKCLRIFSATETLAASINSSTIWFASRIWYIPAETTQLGYDLPNSDLLEDEILFSNNLPISRGS